MLIVTSKVELLVLCTCISFSILQYTRYLPSIESFETSATTTGVRGAFDPSGVRSQKTPSNSCQNLQTFTAEVNSECNTVVDPILYDIIGQIKRITHFLEHKKTAFSPEMPRWDRVLLQFTRGSRAQHSCEKGLLYWTVGEETRSHAVSNGRAL